MTILRFSGHYEREPLEDALTRTLGAGYVVERELMGGGMSRVFVTREIALDRRVAVKVLAPDLVASVSIERFRREILVSAGLQHPHIVPVLSSGETDGLPYFIMPFIDGESIRARLRDGPMPVRDVVRIMRDVARALEFAHARGVVHRDIKPDNILLAGGVAVVTDFGVSKALSMARSHSGPRSETITTVGTSLGTPAYMAPEQVAADPATDHRADIYAWGVTAFEMLLGEAPFRGDTPQALLAAQLTHAPPSLGDRRTDIPSALESLLRACVAKRPEDRPDSASAVIARLDDPATLSGDFSAPAAPLRRLRRPSIALVATTLVVVLGISALLRSVVAPPLVPIDPRSVAVPPIVDLTDDSSASRDVRALTAEIRSALGRVPGVRVASPEGVARDSAPEDSKILGARLRVATVLESSLMRDGTRMRLAVRLVNASDGLSRWADVLEGDASSLFDARRQITDRLVLAISSALVAASPDSAHGLGSPPR